MQHMNRVACVYDLNTTDLLFLHRLDIGPASDGAPATSNGTIDFSISRNKFEVGGT